jgi:hypothetical protein
VNGIGIMMGESVAVGVGDEGGELRGPGRSACCAARLSPILFSDQIRASV